jgi:hypothetical protein
MKLQGLLLIVLIGCARACGQSPDDASPAFDFRLVDRAVTAERNGEVPIDGVLRVKNGRATTAFSWLDTWSIDVRDKDEKPIFNKGWRDKAADWSRQDARILNPRQTASILVGGRLKYFEGQPHFLFTNPMGDVILFGPITPGQYSFSISFSQNPDRFTLLVAEFLFEKLNFTREQMWKGSAQTRWQKLDVFIP